MTKRLILHGEVMVRREMQTCPKSKASPQNPAGLVPSAVVGVIRADELYTLKEFKRRLEFTNATLRSARRAGLRVYYVHKRGFVLGRDWIAYILEFAGCQDGELGCGHA